MFRTPSIHGLNLCVFFFHGGDPITTYQPDWEPIRHKGCGGGARTLANDGNDGRSDAAPWMDCKSEGGSERGNEGKGMGVKLIWLM